MTSTQLPVSSADRWAAVPRLAAAGIALVVIGAFGAWATVSVAGTGVDATKGGMDGDGTLTLLLALAAGAVVAAGVLRPARWQRFALLAPAVLIVLIAVIDALDVMGSGEGAIDVSVGWGLWATVIGGGLITAEAVKRLRS